MTETTAKPNRKRSRIWRTFCILMLIGIIAVVCAWWVSKPRDLFSRATRVPGFKSGEDYPSRWGWRSDRELVYLSDVPYKQIISLNMDTGLQSSVAFPPSNLNPGVLEHFSICSPDGLSRLVRVNGPRPKGTSFVLRPISKGGWTSSGELPTDSPYGWFWASDSSGLVSLGNHGFMVLRNPALHPEKYSSGGLSCKPILWFDGHNQVGILEYSSVEPPPRTMVVARLGNPTVTRKLPLKLPVGAQITGVELSPLGDRVAWWVAWRDTTPTWVDRVMRWIRRQPNSFRASASIEGVLISKPDGTEMRELGRVKGEFAPEGMGAVNWMPDGKRLCIFYKHGFYLVPVD